MNLQIIILKTVAAVAVGSSAVLGHINIADDVLNSDIQLHSSFLGAQSVIGKSLDEIYQLIESQTSPSPDIAANTLGSGNKFRPRLIEITGLTKNVPLPSAGKDSEGAPPVGGSISNMKSMAKKQPDQEGKKAEQIWAVRIQWALIMGLIGFLIGYGPPRRQSSVCPQYPIYRSWPNGQKLSHRRTDAWRTQRFPTNRVAGRRLAPALC